MRCVSAALSPIFSWASERVFPYRSTISPRSFSILAVFWGVVWVNELKGLCRGSRRSSGQGLRFAGFGVMMVFAEIYRVSRLWWAGPSARPLFSHACLDRAVYLRTALVRVLDVRGQDPASAQLISRDQRVCAKTFGGHRVACRPAAARLCFGLCN